LEREQPSELKAADRIYPAGGSVFALKQTANSVNDCHVRENHQRLAVDAFSEVES
jgi:hypothetical protein